KSTASKPASVRISTSRATASTIACGPPFSSYSGVPGNGGKCAIATTGLSTSNRSSRAAATVVRSVHDAADGTIRVLVDGASADVAWVLDQLWAPIVAVTAAHGGRENGLISSTVVTASLLPESPRIAVQLSKTNLTHDLVRSAGALAVHFLPDDDRGLELFRAL